MKSWSAYLSLLGLLAVTSIGCHKDPGAVAAQNTSLFQSADPQVKLAWDTAQAAAATNGYVVAITSLRKLRQGNLSPEQLKAVDQTLTSLNERMYTASNKSDAAASQAIQDLRKSMAR